MLPYPSESGGFCLGCVACFCRQGLVFVQSILRKCPKFQIEHLAFRQNRASKKLGGFHGRLRTKRIKKLQNQAYLITQQILVTQNLNINLVVFGTRRMAMQGTLGEMSRIFGNMQRYCCCWLPVTFEPQKQGDKK